MLTRFAALLALLLTLGGCGSSFPHDNSRVQWPTQSLVLTAPADGSVVSVETDVISSTIGVEHLIASWNADVPDGAGLRIEARVRTDADAAWSDWLTLGEVGRPLAAPITTRSSGGWAVDVDTLTSTAWFKQSQLRVSAAAKPGKGDATVMVHRLDLTRSLILSKTAAGLRRERVGSAPDWNALGLPSHAELSVPFLSQKTPKPELSGRLCSPTSVAMVMRWAGKSDVTVETVAAAAYDQRHDLYGNWPRNVQAAWSLGVPGRVVRIGTLIDAWRLLAQGVPIVASIKAAKGQLRDAPYSETDGHLIVLRGYDADGNFLVNDPAASTPEQGQRLYRRSDIATVWLGNGRGTAYLFTMPGEAAKLDEALEAHHPAVKETTK